MHIIVISSRKAELLTTTTSAPEISPSQSGAGVTLEPEGSLAQSLLAARQRLEQEAAKLSVKAQSTIQRIKQLTNSSRTGDTCQSAEDCGDNQVSWRKAYQCFIYRLIGCCDRFVIFQPTLARTNCPSLSLSGRPQTAVTPLTAATTRYATFRTRSVLRPQKG